MAGRNREKLERERESLAKEFPAMKDTAILTGDAEDLDSLQNIASQTKVLISTSGPYAKIGNKVVEACVVAGTHYCDITGQAAFRGVTSLCHCLRPQQALSHFVPSEPGPLWDTVAFLLFLLSQIVYNAEIAQQFMTYAKLKASAAGEAPWVKRMMKAHNAEATRKGVKVVHCCGFDSIPSDLGTLFMVDYMQEKLNR